MKKIIRILCVMSCMMLMLSACGKENKEYDTDKLKESFKAALSEVTDGNPYEESAISKDIVLEEKLIKVALDTRSKLTDDTKGAWEEPEFEKPEIANGEITLKGTISTSDRDVLATAVFEEDPENDYKMTMKSLAFEPVYTTGEKLGQAGMNTLLGMGTVFAVLIFMAFIISLFKYVNIAERKVAENRKNKLLAQRNNTDNETTNQNTPAIENDYTDDLELVAVITAAISASENVPADGFVVRSIRRR